MGRQPPRGGGRRLARLGARAVRVRSSKVLHARPGPASSPRLAPRCAGRDGRWPRPSGALDELSWRILDARQRALYASLSGREFRALEQHIAKLKRREARVRKRASGTPAGAGQRQGARRRVPFPALDRRLHHERPGCSRLPGVTSPGARAALSWAVSHVGLFFSTQGPTTDRGGDTVCDAELGAVPADLRLLDVRPLGDGPDRARRRSNHVSAVACQRGPSRTTRRPPRRSASPAASAGRPRAVMRPAT